jgi:hypothetical protein
MGSRQHPPHEGLQAWDSGGYAPEVAHFDGSEKLDKAELPGYPVKRICGLAARTFWIVIGIVAFVFVVGAAVGGGVGASLAENHSKAAANTSR